MVSAHTFDTTSELKQLVNDLKSFKNLSYDYTMDAKFPNGDKDHLKGVIYFDIDDKFYYNSCDAFTMIYTAHWFYKADHKNKTLTIINLDKQKGKDKELKKAIQKEMFQNGATTTFLDSIVLKTATIKKLKREAGMLYVKLGFPASMVVQKIDLVYNTSDNLLSSYDMVEFQPWQRTSKGIEGMEVEVKFNNFKKVTDQSMYRQDNFFSYKKSKLELKKYDNYKLSAKT